VPSPRFYTEINRGPLWVLAVWKREDAQSR